jgi:1-phosphatidylinositol phosphodiesterase
MLKLASRCPARLRDRTASDLGGASVLARRGAGETVHWIGSRGRSPHQNVLFRQRNRAARPFVLVAVLLALLATAQSGSAAGTNPPSFSLTNWMGALDGSLKLSQLSIPGAHNAGARAEPLAGTSKCQNLSIGAQFEAGVRFLDVRCRHVKDGFAIYHGSFSQNLSFDDVLDGCWSFLKSHASECIVMSIKEEHVPENVTRSFEQTFEAYVKKQPAGWWLGAAVPTLDEARGKIVLLRRFSAAHAPKGLAASPWPDNTTFAINSGPARFKVQDKYKVPDKEAKWAAITNLFAEARAGPADTLYLNFASGYEPLLFGFPSITAVAGIINPRLAAYFAANASGRFGIVPMDFVEPETCLLIVRTNF